MHKWVSLVSHQGNLYALSESGLLIQLSNLEDLARLKAMELCDLSHMARL